MSSTLTELRLELPDHPGALAAVTRELAALGANVVEVAIHEVDGSRAVDEIVVTTPDTVPASAYPAAVAGAGAVLLSMRLCRPRIDPVVAALTWAGEASARPQSTGLLQRGVEVATGISPVQVVTAAVAGGHDVTATALRRGRPVVQRVEYVPDFMTEVPPGGRWLLAAPDRAEGDLVVVASRPFSTRFTATELRRLTALLACHERLPRAAWSAGLASNA